jgi:hypothetical protein
LIWDYITLSAALIVGLVYGMWVGEYWYKVVYHENVHNGLVDYIASFSYRVAIPSDVDETKEPEATCKNGIMKVTFTKRPEVQPKKISVRKE